MPPEVVRGGIYAGAMYTKAADVYSLGMVFWEVYWIRERAEYGSDERHCAPFSNIRKNEVITICS
jgi:hypothetical protein